MLIAYLAQAKWASTSPTKAVKEPVWRSILTNSRPAQQMPASKLQKTGKSIRLGLTAGLRVFVCTNMAFSGDFTPVLAKHTKSFNLVDTLSVGVDRIQRNFEPMQRQVESWRQAQITDAQAKLIFYSAFVDGKLDAPKSLLPDVHRLYFETEYGVLAANDVELVERVHQRFQEARSGSAVQGDGQVGGISQSIACMIPAVPFTVVTPASGIRSASLSADLVQPTSANPVYG